MQKFPALLLALVLLAGPFLHAQEIRFHHGDWQSALELAAREHKLVFVDAYTTWCGPCRMMAPQFEAAAQRMEPQVRLAKVDTEAAPALAQRYAIRSIPTLILFHHGREVARHSGAMPLSAIVQWTAQALQASAG